MTTADRPQEPESPEKSAVLTATRTPSPPWSNSAKLVVASALFASALVMGYTIRSVFGTVALAGFIAFLLARPIRYIHERLGIRKGVALLLTYVIVLIGLVLFGLLLATAIVDSVRQLDPVGTVEAIRDWLRDNIDDLRRMSLFGVELEMDEVVDSLLDSLGAEEEVADTGVRVSVSQLEAVLGGTIVAVRTVAGFVAAIATSALVTLIVAMYLNIDSHKFHAAVFRSVPKGYEGDALLMADRLQQVWSGYLYGQVINSIITGVLVWFVLWVVGMPGAVVMGFIMALLNMIPTFGPILAAIPGVLAALVNGSTRLEMSNLAFALLVTVIYLVVVQLQANIIAPKVVGTAVRLPPAVIMLGLIAGFAVGKLLGSLLAVPVIATLRDIVTYLYAKLIDRDPFPERPVAPDDAV